YTAILNQVRTLNNNTDNQDFSSNHPTSDKESNLSDKVNLEIEAKAEIEIILRSVVDPETEVKNVGDHVILDNPYSIIDINKLTLPNNPGEGSSSSFTITTEVQNQPIEEIKGKQPQYNTEMPIENNKTLQQIIEQMHKNIILCIL
ncbi:16711_t:CDS:2, partial [Gigaspora margarita]